MNNKANIMMGVFMAVFIFLFGMIYINYLPDSVTAAQNSDNLDCSNSSITDGQKLTCLGTDIIVPGFIIIILSIAGGAITSKLTG